MAGINNAKETLIIYNKKFLNTIFVIFCSSLFIFYGYSFLFCSSTPNERDARVFLFIEVKRFGLPGRLKEYHDELRSKKKLVFVFEGKQGVDIYDYFLSNGNNLGWILQEKTEKIQMQKKGTTLVLQRLEQDSYKLEMTQKKNGHYFLLTE